MMEQLCNFIIYYLFDLRSRKCVYLQRVQVLHDFRIAARQTASQHVVITVGYLEKLHPSRAQIRYLRRIKTISFKGNMLIL